MNHNNTSGKAIAICLTINNWTQEQFDDLTQRGTAGQYRYLLVGKEVGPDHGLPHLHIYCQLKGQRSLKALKKEFFNLHVEPVKNREAWIAYCKKDGDWVEFGEYKQQGKRSDLDKLKVDILKGKSVDDICMENPDLVHQYGRTLDRIEAIALRKRYRTWTTEAFWYFGAAGTGKTHKAFEGFTPETHYVKNLKDEWWDGYTGQETVIINEFRGQIPYAELLTLADKFPHTVKQRNKEPVPFLAKRLIVTSPMRPEEVYSGVLDRNDNIEQLISRFFITELTTCHLDKCPRKKDDGYRPLVKMKRPIADPIVQQCWSKDFKL